ncbi:RHS repeat-associated core domain-containing protein [Rathayibacter toxicus]|uniref:RHS repeat-associated core domain-containing protein n=1 Tax=Rathayibacter toxicus TaxID=145458 RepID=UPI0009E1D786|nr:RHS repeat-associated core domain-containing protein [Rathayibacter toxicus]
MTGVGGRWLGSGWRGERGTGSWDPWGVVTVAAGGGGVPVGVSVTAGGGVAVAGVEWLGFRVYDPGTRGFLSVDPLEPVVGSGWVGNPYSYAGNDPLHAVDPWGLRPVTDEELRVYREGNNGVFAGAGKWLNDNKDYLFAAALVAVGVVAICSGVGGPVGLLLVAAGGGMVGGCGCWYGCVVCSDEFECRGSCGGCGSVRGVGGCGEWCGDVFVDTWPAYGGGVRGGNSRERRYRRCYRGNDRENAAMVVI